MARQSARVQLWSGEGSTLYLSAPFRTPERLLAELAGAPSEWRQSGFRCDFTLAEMLLMMAELVDFDPALTKGALRILGSALNESNADAAPG
jgi:hypothetical protein